MRTVLGILLVAALLPATAHAQAGAKKLNSPQQLWTRFLRLTDDAGKADDQATKDRLMTEAGRLFDLSDIKPASDRDERGRLAAAQLSDYLNRTERPTPWEFDNYETGKKQDVYKSEKGPITCERQEDESWLFTAETRLAVAVYSEKVADREATGGAGEYRDATTWVRDLFPLVMRKRAVLLAYWQWIALGALVLAGIVVSLLIQVLILLMAQRIAKRRGVELKRGRKMMRPFGLIATGTIWYVGLKYLLLGETAYAVLMNSARFVLMVGVVWSASRVIDWIAEIFAGMARATRSKLDDILVPMVRRVVKIVVVILGMVWIAENMGQDIGTLLAGLGIGGIAIALASRDSVENFFGAITILADRPFEVGDWIVMGDIEGTVSKIGFRSTRVRTFYNSLITFPNAMLIRSAVDNLGRRLYRRLKLQLGVTYDTPPEKLEAFIEGIRELIRRHPHTRKDYYHVYFHGYGDNSLDILVYLFLVVPDWGTELRERQNLLMDILRLSRELKVEFAFPTRTIHMLQSGAPEHASAPEDSVAAWRIGQEAASAIVAQQQSHRFTGPVQIGRRPDEAIGDDDGE